MVLGSIDSWHKTILSKILGIKGIKTPLGMPDISDGKMYEVLGMGLCYFDGKTMNVFGRSEDYGIGPNKEFNERLKQQLEAQGWEVQES